MSNAAGILLRTPDSRALFLKRRDGQGWAFPGGKIEDGETPEQAARRETQEETGHAGSDPLVQIDGGDFTTFRQDVEEFEPRLNEEHSEHVWAPMDAPPEPLHPGVAATLGRLRQGNALDRREYDDNGWFTVHDNPLSKVGVYQYSGRSIGGDADPTKMYGVYRPPEELGSEETIKSFRLMPWTDDHPGALLGAKTKGLVPAEEKGVHGVIGEHVYFKDGTLYGNVKVFSEALAREIASGKRELSCGYHCQFLKQDGVYEGQAYQYVQRNIRGNHVASVDKGRMGSSVRVLDAAECCLTFALDMKEALMAEKRKDEAEGTVDADTVKLIEGAVADSFNSLVGELERKGYSKEYATKIAGKVAAEKGMTGHHDSTDGVKVMSGTAADAKGEVKDPAGGKEDPKKDGDLKVGEDRKRARDARDSARSARDAKRTKDEMSSEEEEAADAAECAEDAEEEKEDEGDESKEARDRRSARDRRAGARDARKSVRDRRARDAKDAKGKGMDAAEITALVQRETAGAVALGRRDAIAAQKLYQRLSPIVGAFDHDEMSLADMATYGLKKLGQPEAKDPVTALDYFLAGRGQNIEPHREALDSTSSGEDFVSQYIAA